MLIKRQLRSIRAIFNKYSNISTSETIQKIGFPYIFNRGLVIASSFGKVNVTIDSKYYHEELPTKVSSIIDLIVNQKKLNEKGMLLQHLAHVVTDDARIILSKDQYSIINKQLNLWKGRSGRFEKVATVAWVIRKLNLFKYNQALYEEIAERLSNDEWYVTFDQSLKALEAFTQLQNQQLKDYIYLRIQRNLNITVWELNMIYYQRITVGLLQNQRFESPLWDKLEDHILKNLGMEYSLKTITDIFMCYSLAQKGSDQFYQMLQKAIYLGHWYNHDFKHRILPGYDQTGEFYALLIKTYSIVKKNCDIYLLPDFLNFIYQGVSRRATNYQHLSSFAKVIQYLPGLFQKQDEEEIINNLLQNKKPNSIVYNQMIEFYDLMRLKGIQIPLNLHKHIESVLLSDINNRLIPASKILQITQYLFENGYILDVEKFRESIDQVVVWKFKYLEAEEAKSVIQLSQKSNLLTTDAKKILLLPHLMTNK